MNQSPLSQLGDWLRINFPGYQHHVALSGAAMLYDALLLESRHTVVLPAFICCDLSAVAKAAGKRVVHLDVDCNTMHIKPDQLDYFLSREDPLDTILLVDHTFGNPFPFLASVRHKYPNLLIIEDSVRALGVRIAGEPVGKHSDWILLSMYKTIPGNRNGAILLTKKPVTLKSGPAAATTLRERTATIPACRWPYELIKRRTPDYPPQPLDREKPNWSPIYGIPGGLCLRRFLADVTNLQRNLMARLAILTDLSERLSAFPAIRKVGTPNGCSPGAYFLSFVVCGPSRDGLLAHLHRKGLFLLRTWDMVPAFYRSFSDTFPFGSTGSEFLARNIVHIPLHPFRSNIKLDRLIRAIKEYLC
jgi:dTDP-4-amino-4,6-dideoxygalactose transaminase